MFVCGGVEECGRHEPSFDNTLRLTTDPKSSTTPPTHQQQHNNSGHHLVGLFCSDATVVARCLGTLPLLACLVAVDGVNATISGILRGSGRQKLGAAVNFAGYVSL